MARKTIIDIEIDGVRSETVKAGDREGVSLMKELMRIRERIDHVLNDYLCEMKPDYDDSITGFNEAWDIVRRILKEEIEKEPK